MHGNGQVSGLSLGFCLVVWTQFNSLASLEKQNKTSFNAILCKLRNVASLIFTSTYKSGTLLLFKQRYSGFIGFTGVILTKYWVVKKKLTNTWN